MVTAATERFGGLDILVNNVGIYPFAPFPDTDPELFEHVLRVNLFSVFTALQAAAKQMIAQGRGGKIINISSIDALHPSMFGLAHYDASKHGVLGLTKNVALELAEHAITVNALAPGAIATPGARRSRSRHAAPDRGVHPNAQYGGSRRDGTGDAVPRLRTLQLPNRVTDRGGRRDAAALRQSSP
jgi:NAD(P)-dependent dehydrogenase (short-subunit alcohol dehydrogenase family)